MRWRGSALGHTLALAYSLTALSTAACLFDPSVPADAEIRCDDDHDCPAGSRCILSGRCSSARDRTPPVLLESSLAPEVVHPGDSVVLSITTDEPVFGSPRAHFDFTTELFTVALMAPDRTTSVLTWEVRGDEPEDVITSVFVLISDEFGNEAEPRAGALRFDLTPAVCGDGVREDLETCDDGGLAPGDGCDADCQVEHGWTCDATGRHCSTRCGDGIPAGGEGCDDGGVAPGDGCDASCLVEPGSVCAGAPSRCAATCGDGVPDPGEACDDGDLTPHDGCDSFCRLEAGFACPPAGACEAVCGDGLTLAREACDDGAQEPGDGCDDACLVESGWSCTLDSPSVCSRCGDGARLAGEACDDGNLNADDGCSPECEPEPGFVCGGSPSICAETCGDDEINPGEACDDGNIVAGDGCTASCAIEQGFSCPQPGPCTAVCGDGLIRAEEQCDDGDLGDADGCDERCQVEAGFVCSGEPSTCQLGCTVMGTTYAPGTTDPTNPCRVCIPDLDPAAFVPLEESAPCSDGIFCNGLERCRLGLCAPGTAPCGGTLPLCDEVESRCRCDFTSCDDRLFCTGDELCLDSGDCQPGVALGCAAPADRCSEIAPGCVQCELDQDCDAEQICDAVGLCQAGEPCPEGRVRTYTDKDRDGVGVGLLNTPCLQLPPPPGHALVTGDCDDDDAAVYRWLVLYRDADGDGVSGEPLRGCFGSASTLPDGYVEVAAPPPFTSFAPTTAVELRALEDDPWVEIDAARLSDGVAARADAPARSALLAVTGHGLAVPPEAVVRGVAVIVTRRLAQIASGGLGQASDASVRLVSAGQPIGGERARAERAWSVGTYEQVLYGGAADAWGAPLTPALVSDPSFGVGVAVVVEGEGVAAEIDAVHLEVYVTGVPGADCDDDDPRVYTAALLSTDADGDRFTTGGPAIRCVGPELPAGLRPDSAGIDCYDANAAAHPGSTFSATVHRGDGSFDYDCDGAEIKVPVQSALSCACDPCRADAAETVAPSANCGKKSSVKTCSGPNCNKCELKSLEVVTSCR